MTNGPRAQRKPLTSTNTRIDPEPVPDIVDELVPLEDEDETAEDAAPSRGELSRAVLALVESQKALADSQPVRKVPFAKYVNKTETNPTGNKRRKLKRRCYQNGSRIFADATVYDEEISLLDQLQPGTFINGRVRVTVKQNGAETDVNIYYPNATPDQRMENKSHWKNLRDMLRQCVNEAKAAQAVTA